MSSRKALSKKDRRMYQTVIAVFLLLCIAIGVACFGYYLKLQDMVKTESSGYMQEISTQMATNANKTISDKYSVLGGISTILKRSDANTYSQLQPVLVEQKKLWNYQNILFIDNNGVIYDESGATVGLSNDQYLQEAIVKKTPSMSTSQKISGKECVIFAIPLQDVIVDGTEMRALAASYDLNTFDKILSMTAFEGKGYAHIVRQDGTIVVRSSSPYAVETGYNVLNSLMEAKVGSGKTIEETQQDIAAGKTGQMEFTLGSTHEYMTYMALGEENWSLLTFVPVETVNAKSEILLKITLLMCAMITIIFALLVASLLVTFIRNKRKLEHIAYVDPVTGGNTIVRFYELAEKSLDVSGRGQYALVYLNIEKFKVLNEQVGKKECDKILCSIEKGISGDLGADESIGRLFGDNFCILAKYEDEEHLADRFERWYKRSAASMEESGALWMPLIMGFGVYVVGNDSLPFSIMIDRAKLSLTEAAAELRGKLRYGIYDEKVRSLLFREKKLEDMMEDALKNGEFQVYLQPKYKTQTEQIGGAEALVRWVHASEGMIYPDEFIPLFEKNGFVMQVDFYVFEQICKSMRKWLDQGLNPVKISINCSRMHLKNMEFLEHYCKIADQYQIPYHLLEIELTENTVFEDVAYLSEIIQKIHAAGFGCSMDDFGSGYSSLNLIQDIPVDTLKLDKVFFRGEMRDLKRCESVVGSVITMSKALSMATVAEGVEEQWQVEMLKRLDCDFIQGYYYAKPMPIAAFEDLAFGENKETTE